MLATTAPWGRLNHEGAFSLRRSASVRRWFALVLLASLLPLSAQAAPWLQRGHDAQGTFATDDEGPAWPDVALQVELPGQPQRWHLVMDGYAYVLVELGRFQESWADMSFDGPTAVIRVDLDTGEMEELARWDSAGDAIASDGERIFVTIDQIGVVAITLEGEEVWTYQWPRRLPHETMRPNYASCDGGLLVHDGRITVGCDLQAWDRESGFKSQEIFDLVARLDAATGYPYWNWTTDATTEIERVSQSALPVNGTAFDPVYPATRMFGLAVSELAVVVNTAEYWFGATSINRNVLTVLDGPTGQFRWSVSSDTRLPEGAASDMEGVGSPQELSLGRPVIMEGLVFAELDGKLQVRNAATSELLDEQDVLAQDLEPLPHGVSDLGLADGFLYVPSDQFVTRFDVTQPRSLELDWATPMEPTPPGQAYDEGPLVAGDIVFLASWNNELGPAGERSVTGEVLGDEQKAANSSVWAFDAEDGRLLWHVPMPGADLRDLALSDGLLVVTDLLSTRLTVFGRTDASPKPIAAFPSAYPAVGENVTVNLASSQPGAQGPVSRYMADWGDGTVSQWQSDPYLTHAYEQAGGVTARFVVGNKANQSASVLHTFHVGASPPVDETASGLEADSDGGWGIFSAAGPGLFLYLVLAVVGGGFGGVAVARRNGDKPSGRLDTYRAALAGTLAVGGDHDATPVLTALRSRLGITDKDHALLVAEVERVTPAAALRPGGLFLGRYRVQERLGAGAGGDVWRAVDEDLDRNVAIKRLAGDALRSAAAFERFREETRLAARLSHPNIVRVHDVETVAEDVFLIMEHVADGSLTERLGARGPMPEEEAVRMATDVLAALSALHGAGVLHRDVKPSNVLLDEDGTAKLSDFTVARQSVSGQTLAEPHDSASLGTLSYMSPEQARGVDASETSDLYAVAATLFKALSGRPPIDVDGLTGFEARERILTQPPALPLKGVSNAVNKVLADVLSKDPARRPPSAQDMAAALAKTPKEAGGSG